jgi:hypothetical protein
MLLRLPRFRCSVCSCYWPFTSGTQHAIVAVNWRKIAITLIDSLPLSRTPPNTTNNARFLAPDGVYNPTMLWPDGKRTRYAWVKDRMADGSEGSRMRRIKGARHSHAVIRAQGRTPGDEGRDAIAANREARRHNAKQGKGWRYGQANVDGI